MADQVQNALTKLTDGISDALKSIPDLPKAGASASGGAYFSSDGGTSKMEQIHALLESPKSSAKLEGMKRLIALISRGRDVSQSFPHVVKNVVCPDIEVKKLVYMYLVHYAEREPDTALLSISTFQKELTNKNQLIRAQSLRVMSSIRVPVIAEVIAIAISQCVSDPSPYVRKTAAHAIPKVFNLDPSTRNGLVESIGQLLGDQAPMVLGSAAAAFNEVCPDRFDLVHKNFRKLCNLMAGVDEWGQIAIVNLLTRYGRSQFVDPNPHEEERIRKKLERRSRDPLRGSNSDDDDNDNESLTGDNASFLDSNELEPDHRHLLNSAQQLLQSRNAGVVMAVCSLYYYLAPLAEVHKVGAALTRIASKSRELQYLVLTNIASMAIKRPEIFSPHLNDFFVRSSDPSFSRALKIEIMTYLASESNISKILREFGSYLRSSDTEFVKETIRAIGRCGSNLPDVTESCMHSLMALLNNPLEEVVAEAIVELKQLLQLTREDKVPIITFLARRLDAIAEPNARASILWIVGEYCDLIPLYGPDIFRVLAKSFADEPHNVKLQTLNLGAKLYIRNPPVVRDILRYVLTLAKYDSNYDIRDKSRMLRALLFNPNPDSQALLEPHIAQLIFTSKPNPVAVNPSAERARYALGTLSHALKDHLPGYQAIPDFATERSDPALRAVPTMGGGLIGSNAAQQNTVMSFGDWLRGEESDEESDGYSEYSEFSSDEDDEEWSDSEGDEFSDLESSDDDNDGHKDGGFDLLSGFPSSAVSSAGADMGMGMGLGMGLGMGMAGMSMGGMGAMGMGATAAAPSSVASLMNFSATPVPASSASSSAAARSLLSEAASGGLSVTYSFPRRPSTFGEQFVTVTLVFSNEGARALSNIHVRADDLPSGQELIACADIAQLTPGASKDGLLNVRFSSVRTPIKFQIAHDGRSSTVSLSPEPGEVLAPMPMSVADFQATQKRLGGMLEARTSVAVGSLSGQTLTSRILAAANMHLVEQQASSASFAARNTLTGKPILVAYSVTDGYCALVLNSEDSMFSPILSATLCQALADD